MNRRFVNIAALLLTIISVLSLVSCGDGNGKGDFTEQSSISKSGNDNTVVKNEDEPLTREYYNWIYSDAFKDFSEACKVTKFPDEIEKALASYSAEKKSSFLRNIFCSSDVVSAIQTVWEYEKKNDSYTHNVVKVEKKQKGVYNLQMKVSTGSEVQEKKYELKISETTKKVILTCLDDQGNVSYFHEILVTNDGYVSVNRVYRTNETWSVLQLMFKGGEIPEGYCLSEENVKETPKSIYQDGVSEGFAGKK